MSHIPQTVRIIESNRPTFGHNYCFTLWERLPAANIAMTPHCRRLSWLEAAPTKVDKQLNQMCRCRINSNIPSLHHSNWDEAPWESFPFILGKFQKLRYCGEY